jgi:hypothetical protein
MLMRRYRKIAPHLSFVNSDCFDDETEQLAVTASLVSEKEGREVGFLYFPSLSHVGGNHLSFSEKP